MIRLIVGVVVVLGLVAAVAFVRNSQSESSSATPTSAETNRSADAVSPVSDTEQTTSTAQSAGQYIPYTDSVIASTPGTKILFFHAPWCSQCRALEQSINAGSIPAGVSIVKVDYDSNQALRKQYGVTIQTTLVKVDDAGNRLDSYVAYDEPTLDAVTQNLLP